MLAKCAFLNKCHVSVICWLAYSKTVRGFGANSKGVYVELTPLVIHDDSIIDSYNIEVLLLVDNQCVGAFQEGFNGIFKMYVQRKMVLFQGSFDSSVDLMRILSCVSFRSGVESKI